MLLLAHHILEAPIGFPESFDETGWAEQLIAWERSVKARGLQDLLGPSTKRALEALLAGTPPQETGKSGNTNGAAMRISPVGISTPVEPISKLVDRVAETCRITQNTTEAIASAAAVAAAISAGIDGADVGAAIEAALDAVVEAERRTVSPGDLARRMELAIALGAKADEGEILSAIHRQIGTSVACMDSIPAAFALFEFTGGDVWRAGLLAANLGGDTDTIGAIAAGMCGAVSGADALPRNKLARLLAVNVIDVEPVVTGLLRLRRAVGSTPWSRQGGWGCPFPMAVLMAPGGSPIS